ncbi:UNVERIFIED_ORG: hypothetical protein J2W66_002668 [Agrobacterium larrymoorei]|nr:hypothetical protein [Agrobacterium larrymoorei]
MSAELLCAAVFIEGQPRKDGIIPDLKLREPIPTGIPGIEPVSNTGVQDAAESAIRLFERTIDDMTAAYPGTAMLDQLFLFPMKLGLSIALVSTAMLVRRRFRFEPHSG